MFAFTAAKRPLGVAASLFSLLLMLSVAGPAAAADEGYLGVMLQELTPSMGKALQMGDRPGVLINTVVADGPAGKAGLQDGDVILEVNGKAAVTPAALTEAVRALAPGDKAEVTVLRDGKQKSLTVEVGKRATGAQWLAKSGQDGAIELEGLEGLKGLEALKGLEGLEGLEGFKWLEDGDTKVMVLPRGEGAGPHLFFHGDGEGEGQHRVIMRKMDEDRGWLGVHMDALNGQLGEYFGVEDGAGVLVTEVVADSPAAKAGLRAGDVIVKAGSSQVDSPDALHEAMGDTKAGDELELQVLRKGSRQTLTATLGEMPADAGRERRLEIIGGDGDEDVKVMAPRMLRRLGRAGGDGDQKREIIIERRHLSGDDEPAAGGSDEDLADVRKEMEALRKELKQLREELKR